MLRQGRLTPCEGEGARLLDFFISYSPADERWASWIAWTLEEAGYRTVLQAWDFVPGTNFVDFMDRGVSESAAVIAVLSRSYERSRYGRMEWQAALRAEPDAPERRLLTVRVEDMPVEGLLATITYVDLASVADTDTARSLLLTRVGHAMDGRARPRLGPGYPGGRPGPSPAGENGGHPLGGRPVGGTGWAGRRRPAVPPPYPRAARNPGGRDAVTVLQVAGPGFGRGQDPAKLQADIWGDLVELADAGAPAPDIMVVSGDLTASGKPRECEQAMTFLTGMRALLGLEPHRIALVPGGGDVSQAACQAYFSTCESDELQPRPPYWPKWRHFARLFHEFYQGLDVVFDADQPWTLFPIPELHTVIAGLNSSMAYSHRPEDQHGFVGPEQAAWFAQALRAYEQDGWLRIGTLRHPLTAAGGNPADALRDADVLSRLTAPRLHALLHGPAGVGGRAAVHGPGKGGPHEQAGTPSFGVRAAGYQLLRFTREGLARWEGRAETAPERIAVEWPGAHAVFAPDGSPVNGGQMADGTGTRAGEELVDAVDPLSGDPAAEPSLEALVARVAEVCRTRHQDSQLRRIPGTPPQLLVTWRETGFVRQQRVAVCAGTPEPVEVERFIDHVHAADSDPDAEYVYDGPPPARELRDRARRRGVRVRSFTEFQGLLDLRDYVAAQTERLTADRQYPPDLYLPQRYRELEKPEGAEHDGLVDAMLRLLDTDHGRFMLLLGDFGHGKTFALRELARRIPIELPQLIPLYIELRTLDKAHSLDGLVAAHLAGHGVETIDLRAFRYMLGQGRIVLLFDGFDELVNQVSYDRAADHLDVLLDAAADASKVVVSSRTQHFRSQEQVLTALGARVGLLPQRRVLAIREFSPDQIRAYLVNRYGADESEADRRMALLEGIPDLLTLCRNPRLLSFVADLDAERLRAVGGTGRAISAAGLYEEVFTAWLTFEERRGHGSPGATPGLTLEQLWEAVTALALRLWESGEAALRLEELTEVTEVLSRLTDNRLSVPLTAHAVGSGSLLERTDEGLFRFIHGSVMEWLVAREAAVLLARGAGGLLSRHPLTQLMVEFLCDIADRDRCREWAEHVLETGEGDSSARENANKILARLRLPVHIDMRNADLARRDLSHRDFSGVNLGGADLTGADLTDSRLTGADLAGAVLRDARLVGARLDRADLRGADLSGADLRRARLAHTDLRGVTVTGGRWHRAALIDVRAGREFWAAPELDSVARSPGMAVDTAIPPASVGVPYGFSMTIGRLPEPVAYHRGYQLIAMGSEDGNVLVCDAVTGMALRTLEGHTDRVYAVKCAGRVLASGAADGTVRLWDPLTGRLMHHLEVHRDGVWPVALSPDGTLLATGDTAGTVTVWSTDTGAALHRLPGHAAPVYTATFSRDGRLLIVGDSEANVRLWKTRSGELAETLPGHHGAVYRAGFSPDGTLLATADGGEGDGGTIRVWDIATRALRHEFTGHTGRVYTVAFEPDGHLLASGDTDGQVRLWDLATGECTHTLEGCSGAVYQVGFAPDSTHFAAGDSDGTVRVWELGTVPAQVSAAGGAPVEGSPAQWRAVPLENQPRSHRGSVWSCVFGPRADRGSPPLLITGSNDGWVRLWDPGTGKGQRVLRGHGRRTSSVTFDKDGSSLAVAGNDGVVRIWDTATGRKRREFTGRSNRLVLSSLHPAEPILATAGNDGDVRFWDLAEPGTTEAGSGEFMRQLQTETDHIWSVTFSPDGRVLAAATDDDTVRIWHSYTGARIATLAKHRARVRSIAFSYDGRHVATGCDDQTIRLWNISEARVSYQLDEHTDRVYRVVFGPGDSWLASASWDGEAIIWTEGRPLHRLRGHRGRLWAAAAHPHRHLLATAGDDRVICLWNAETGERTARLTGHTGRVLSLAFSPDGSQLAGSGEDGTVRLWDMPQEGGPVPLGTLIGVKNGWAALTPSGGYKSEGDVAGEFWHVVGMSRFAPGELDEYLPGIRRLPLDSLLRAEAGQEP